MKSLILVPLIALTACSTAPTKEESSRVFVAATTAMSSAQTRAVTTAHANASLAPAALVLDFSGPCILGGSVAVAGSYDDGGSGSNTTFDLKTTFDACHDLAGTLDGDLRWTSVASGSMFSATMSGSLDFTDSNSSASCDLDLRLTVNGLSVAYAGTVCGYDVQTDLRLGH